jgi:hypothetical protein
MRRRLNNDTRRRIIREAASAAPITTDEELNATYAQKVHLHAAGDIDSGVLDPARLGEGTADSTKYLRGDGTWTTPSVAATTAWGDITGTLADQTDLQVELDGKADTVHTHAIADTTGLQAALDGKATSSHSHAISDVTNLQTSLDAKANEDGTNFVIENRTSDPGAPTTGQIWLRTDL